MEAAEAAETAAEALVMVGITMTSSKIIQLKAILCGFMLEHGIPTKSMLPLSLHIKLSIQNHV